MSDQKARGSGPRFFYLYLTLVMGTAFAISPIELSNPKTVDVE